MSQKYVDTYSFYQSLVFVSPAVLIHKRRQDQALCVSGGLALAPTGGNAGIWEMNTHPRPEYVCWEIYGPLHSSEVISSTRGVKVSSSALSTFECVFMLGEEVVGKSGQPNG